MSKLRLGKYCLIQSRSNSTIVLESNNSSSKSNKVTLNKRVPDFLGSNEHQLWSFNNRTCTFQNKLTKEYLYATGESLTTELFKEHDDNFCWIVHNNFIRTQNGSNLVVTMDSNQQCVLKTLDESLISQQWIIDNQPALFFYIKLKSNPSLVFDVRRDDRRPGAKVIVYDNKNTFSDNQLWCEDENGIIRSKLNDYALDTSNGNEVQLQPFNSMNVNQQWTINGNFIENLTMPSFVLQLRPGNIFSSAYPAPFCLENPLLSNNTLEWVPEFIPRQSISLSHSGCGKYFMVRSESSGLVFEVEESNALSGVKIKMAAQAADSKKKLRQQFYLDETTGTIRSILRNFVIDATDGYLSIAPFDPYKKLQQWMFENNRIINKHNLNLMLQAASDEEGALVSTNQIAPIPQQLWTLSHLPARCFYIVSGMSCEKVLDIRGDKVDAGGQIILYDRKSDICPNQLWYEDERGFIRSKLNGYAIDSTKDEMVTAPYNPSNVDQQWVIVGDRIQNKFNNKLVADAAGASKSNCTSIIKHTFHGGDNQRWKFEYISL